MSVNAPRRPVPRDRDLSGTCRLVRKRLGWPTSCASLCSSPRSRLCSFPPLRPVRRAIRSCRCGRCRPGCGAPDLGVPRDHDRLVQRAGARRRRGRGDERCRADPVRGLRAGGRCDGPRSRVLGLADLLPGRGRAQPHDRRDLRVGQRIRRQGRAGDADRGRSSARPSTCPAGRRRGHEAAWRPRRTRRTAPRRGSGPHSSGSASRRGCGRDGEREADRDAADRERRDAGRSRSR